MKKLSLAVAVAATLGAGVAGAYTVAVPADGYLVPNVIHNGSGDTTAIALVNHNTTTGAWIYWTFFDQDSKHITDGAFPMTAGDMRDFIWSEESGLGLEGVRGYLVFASGTVTAGGARPSAGTPTAIDSGLISVAAFQADAVNGDAVFVPTFPMEAGPNTTAPITGITADGDYTTGTDLSVLDELSITSLRGGAAAGEVVAMRYAMDDDFSSAIVLWATGKLNNTFTVNMYDDEQNRKSVNFVCPNTELCFVDPTTILGRPAGFTNGYIRFETPTDLNEDVTPPSVAPVGGSFVSYTVINSASYGATQTILNTHHPR